MISAYKANKRYNEKKIPFLFVTRIFFLVCIIFLSAISCSVARGAESSSNISENGALPVNGELVFNFSGTESILTTSTSGSNQELPAIWEDRIIWISYDTEQSNPESDLSDIYLYNLSSGRITKLQSGLERLTQIDIWGDRAVWNSYRNGNSDIYLLNLSNYELKQITNDSANQIKPRIWGSNIVWQEGDTTDTEWRIYLYNITRETAFELGDGSGLAMSPDIWDDRVVWEDWRNGADFDLYFYNITTGFQTQITSDPANQMLPSIWKDLIVWQDDRYLSSQIFLYNILTGKETQVTNTDANLENPVICGNFIAYVNQSDYFDIYVVDIMSGEEGKISRDITGSAQQDPDVWGNRIVWTDNRNGDSDIFLYTSGITLPPLTADFTQNITQGEAPLAIQFTDNSSGDVKGWTWDFGDNTTSRERNPIHTYLNAGAFSVILTVHNHAQRNAVEKAELIAIGTAPIPHFDVNVSSGPAPLTILFTDSSAGHPTSLFWDFGDGSTSDEPNPVHVYEAPGIYTPSLTVHNSFGNASLIKQDFITVIEGSKYFCHVPSDGINFLGNGNSTQILVNITPAMNCSYILLENNSILESIPDSVYGFRKLILFSNESRGFSLIGNNTLSGSLTRVYVISNDITPSNFSQEIGNNSFFNFSLELSTYPLEGTYNLVAWEGTIPDDFTIFDDIKTIYNYGNIEGIAYTVRIGSENISQQSPATLMFGVSSDWVRNNGWGDNRTLEIQSLPDGATVWIDNVYYGLTPINVTDLATGPHQVVLTSYGYETYNKTMNVADERDSIHVIRIGDDGLGEVLNTTFIGHDPVRNLDFFRAESPNGLSTFGLASLSKSGNIFQLIQLLAIKFTGSGSSSHGNIIRSHSTSEITNTQVVTSVPTPRQTPPGTGTESPGATNPYLTTSPTVKKEPGEPAPPPTSDGQGTPSPSPPPWLPQTLKILENLSIIFVVIFVTVIFYLRWKRKEE